MRYSFFWFLVLFCFHVHADTLQVGRGKKYSSIKSALEVAHNGDTVMVFPGDYREGNIIIKKAIVLTGINRPLLDGLKKSEVLSIKSDSVTVKGFRVVRSNFSTLEDPAAIKVYDSNYVVIEDNILEDNFFGIYIQYGRHCAIKNNVIKAYGKDEQMIGNGIHCWKSDSLLIIGNNVSGHRDGIYFEFVTNSLIWRNVSHFNIRYGLHFMFSNNDAYISNVFKNNGSGVAVMFTKHVRMFNNHFMENWGDASYGLLLKEISDCHILGNKFTKNTAAIYLEGVSRAEISRCTFEENGWGMQIQASCMDNHIFDNDFIRNTFDVSTNGDLVLNSFYENYWDKYEGYDLNKDKTGDIPYHPLSLFSMIAESNASAMLMYRSFVVMLMDRTEKIMPSITPDNFVDNQPRMKRVNL
ncbi:MAG: nitrous oxide reductase family maturation protein NosD [Saprospiraceae bacterium]|nr:nitrous oxide reductase family maturation protein NosD [Saprospiraceae bacterium]